MTNLEIKLKEEIRRTHRIYKIIIIILLLIMGFQYYAYNHKSDANVPTIIGHGTLEKLDDTTFTVIPDEELEQYDIDELPPLPSHLK